MMNSLWRGLKRIGAAAVMAVCAFLLLGQAAQAAGGPPLKKVKIKANASSSVRGRIDGGKKIDLRWANRSGTACWPATRNEYFDGNHVLYVVDMPARSVLNVELQPDRGVDLSLYGYQTSTKGSLRLPPNGAGAPCEASALHGIRSRRVTSNPGKVE
ncbi:MAG: hypothetical protein AAGA56_27070, partial [Myxococcota bacterium]